MTHTNVEVWTRANAEYTDARAEEAWAEDEVTWGVWHVPEREVHALPDVAGKDVVELGCGTAYVGAWLKKLGAARVVGVDPTPAQLATARRCEEKFGLGLELVEAFAEDVGCRTGRSTSSSRSTAPRSGPTRTAGSPRPRGCCAPAASSSSSATRRS